MKTTTELTIRGERAQLERLLVRVEELLSNGWKRDHDAEERLARHGTVAPFGRCFSCTAKNDRPAAGFCIHGRGPNELQVSNVVPLVKQELAQDECNRVLMEFEREFVGPAAAETGVATEIAKVPPTLEHDLSLEAVRLLRAFSATASRSDLRPIDRARWNAFLVRAHQDESLFDRAMLDEWLEHDGWAEEVRHQLVAEYEAARSLLLVYDDEQGERH